MTEQRPRCDRGERDLLPVTIVKKEKTKAVYHGGHPCLIPLKIVGFSKGFDALSYLSQAEVGDVCFSMPSQFLHHAAIFNATKGVLIERGGSDLLGAILLVRAYEIEQIILCNDDAPAPVE